MFPICSNIHNGNLYLIFVYDGHVTAYSEEGLFVDCEIEEGEDQFKSFFKALKYVIQYYWEII